MANHNCKELDRMLAEAVKAGYRIEKKGVIIKIYPPNKELPLYTGHMGERGFHPIRRYFKNVCKMAA